MSRLLPVLTNTASMTVWSNPLAPPTSGEIAPIGTPLRELAPATQSPLMLRLNGQWTLRSYWWRPVLPGDVIEWHVLPMGGNAGSRTVLSLVAVLAISYFTMGAGAAAIGLTAGSTTAMAVGLVANLAAMALINALVPIQQAGAGGAPQSPNSVYNVALSGNQARLNQPIPVIYGRMQTFPDFACQPYTEFDDQNDQYFYAVYCIGQGNYTIERLQIDDTAASSFQDITYEILAPGQAPTLALANVVSAPEVSGQDLKSGEIVGGFAASGPTLLASAIGIDIVFPRGLGLADSGGTIGNISATFQVDARPINDFGTPTGNWTRIGTETVTDNSSVPQRRSFRYEITVPARLEVRVIRSDVRNESIRALHDMVWAGLRAYLSAPAPLAPSATHMALKVRASEQLSGLSQRKISVIARRKVRTWSQGGGWGAEVESRNPMWARLDKLTNTVYGDGLEDARIDLVTHEALAAVYESRQDRFDMLFDSKVTSIDADRTICMAGRAVPFQRGGVCTVARDSQQSLPVTAFTSRDILPGSMSIGYALATEVTADGVIVEYFNNRAWDWREILCKAPGVTTPINAVRQRIMGITGATHAEREGLYLAAQNVYRRKFPKFATEMQGLLPAYGSAAVFAPALPGWGQAGDVAFWNSTTKVMGLTEPVAFTAGAQHYISIRRDDGSLTDAIAVTPGPTAYDVVLASVPLLADNVTAMTLVLDDANRERPKYVFGASGEHRIMVRILGIAKRGKSQGGAPSVTIECVAEDDRVHTADSALLPSPGETQDPVDPGVGDIPEEGSGGAPGTITLITISDQSLNAGDYFSGGGQWVSYTLANNGTSSKSETANGGTLTTNIANQWSATGAVETSSAALYEARATHTVGASAPVGADALSTWLNLGTTRTWRLDGTFVPGGDACTIKVEIREVSTGVIVDTCRVSMGVTSAGSTPP